MSIFKSLHCFNEPTVNVLGPSLRLCFSRYDVVTGTRDLYFYKIPQVTLTHIQVFGITDKETMAKRSNER